LMEALPASTANVVYGGAVPVLCAKLLEIHFIDLAEQALSVSLSGALQVSPTNQV
jgi:E3 ubiquitin-protein ligase TRIP12